MRLAVIPARGGSKRIPRKNVREFAGKPMIAWSINAAIKSQCFDRIIVSTDDKEIAHIARKHGADVPFIRPQSLADDHTSTIAVIQHAIQTMIEGGFSYKYVCCVYPTAPFIDGADLRFGLDVLLKSKASYAIPITTYAFPIQRALKITSVGRLEMFDQAHAISRSQDLTPAYHDAGQFYWGSSNAWLEGTPIYGPYTVPIILPRYRVQDIDTQEDWDYSRWIFEAMRQEKNFE